MILLKIIKKCRQHEDIWINMRIRPRFTTKNTAFTLAEVLITLSIIGIVASISIPALMNNIQQQQFKEAWKKTYSSIAAANNRENADSNYPYPNLTQFTSAFIKRFNTIITCNSSVDEGCWHKVGKWYTLTNKPINNNIFQYPGFILSDGTLVTFSSSMGNQTGKRIIANNITYYIVYVDTNGFPPPNSLGIDIFALKLEADKVEPGGVSWANSPDTCSRTDPNADALRGAGCSFKAITGANY